MGNLRHTTNELLVGLFNYILYIEERNLKKRGIELSMNDVHILENIKKASDNSRMKGGQHEEEQDDRNDPCRRTRNTPV